MCDLPASSCIRLQSPHLKGIIRWLNGQTLDPNPKVGQEFHPLSGVHKGESGSSAVGNSESDWRSCPEPGLGYRKAGPGK